MSHHADRAGHVLVRCILAITLPIALLAPSIGWAQPATFLYPTAGDQDVIPVRPFVWTSVPGALAYHLWVGTAPYTPDLVNTGELERTSYLPSSLPAGRALYAHLWTKFAGNIWYSSSISFVTGPVRAYFVSPLHGASDVNPSQPITWSGVPEVVAYHLAIGSTLGGSDLVNSGVTQRTSYVASALPAGRTVYARLSTKRTDNTWISTDIAFVTGAPRSYFLNPTEGAWEVNPMLPLRWAGVPDARAYSLSVGTTPGARDVLDAPSVLDTTLLTTQLPAGRTLYARLGTNLRKKNEWRYSDITFTTSAEPLAWFVYPQDGTVGVTGSRVFQWSQVAGAQAYRLTIGTTPGGTSVLSTPDLSATSYTVPPLPSAPVLYARVWTRYGGAWRYSDAAFSSTTSSPAPAQMVAPAPGTTGFDARQVFQWTEVALARGYRLEIGTAPGAADLHDSGEIGLTRRLVPYLPAGPTLYGRLSTRIGTTWQTAAFTFTVAPSPLSMEARITAVLGAASAIRRMADLGHGPYGWTPLWATVHGFGAVYASCGDYSETLRQVVRDLNVAIQTRLRPTCFYWNRECHIVVEVLGDGGRWVVIDPTFALAPKRRSDGAWATAEEVSAATRARAWSDITYVFAGTDGDLHVERYYLDYPLLYLNPDPSGPQAPALPYMDEVTPPVNTPFSELYVLQCVGDLQATAVINGTPFAVSCGGLESLSYAFGALTIAPPVMDPFRLYQPNRFVF